MDMLDERFWTKVDVTGECWRWLGAINHNGYGHFRFGGKAVRVHRLSFMNSHGPIPSGAVIDHVCHNRGCVKPGHLRLVTGKQNNENRGGANRNSTTGVRGVIPDNRRGGYIARVTHKRTAYDVGHFDSQAEAEAAVIAKRLELFTHNDMDRVTA